MRPLKEGSYRSVPGVRYGTPKEIWGFLSSRAGGTPLAVTRRFLGANEDLLGLNGIRGKLKRRSVVESLGAWHVILGQVHHDLPIHRGYVSVHIGKRDRRVYLVKNRATPSEFLPDRLNRWMSRRRAIRRARAHKKIDARDCRDRDVTIERVWFPYKGELVAAYKLLLPVRARPRRGSRRKPRRQDWIMHMDARSGKVMRCQDNLAGVNGRARVFNPNPVIALGGHEFLLDAEGRPVRHVPAEAYSTVRLRDLDGTGYLDGTRVTTRPTGDKRVRRTDHQFLFASTENGFEEAMVYFHIDEAIRYFESLGFRGMCAIFNEPVAVNVKGTTDDRSWYSAGRKQLFFGLGGGVNDAEDAETILHELGHAVQDAICPNFGLSKQAAAMGEGFGDYLALSFFADRRPKRYATCVMTWDGITWSENDPPCVRNLNAGLTLECFDWRGRDVVHQNGQIWSETLWDVRKAVGRKVADTIILESHYQLDGFTTFARGARAIIDADRILFKGRHRRRLIRIFRRRGIAPVE